MSEPLTAADASRMCAALGSAFRRVVNVTEILERKLSGLTIPLEGATITFASSITITGSLQSRQFRVVPPAVINVGGLVGKANVSGLKLNADMTTATPMIDGWPDVVTIDLKW